jgi:Ca2+-binding RTX toxin-like protein
MGVRGALLTVAVGVALLAPGAAEASVQCTFDASAHVARVSMLGDGDSAVIKRIGTSIGVNGVPCGAAALGTTSKIAISGTYHQQQLTLDLSAGTLSPAFVPGPKRTGRIATIAIAAALYADTPVTIVGSPGNDIIVAGKGGILLDGDANIDMTIGAGRLVKLDGGAGSDRLWAGGATGVGGPVTKALTVIGGPGDDSLVGGDGNDTLSDGPGADGAIGGGGDDVFLPGTGNDSYSGGAGNDTLKASSAQDGKHDAFHGDAGTDTADFSARTQRVCLELATNFDCDGGPEDRWYTMEVLIGGSGNDTLLGLTGDPVHLIGGPGNDRLWGGGGTDVLEGGPGNDGEYGDLGDDVYVEGAAPNGGDDIGLVVVQNCVNPDGCEPVDFGPDRGTDTVDYSARSAPVDVSLDTFQNDGQLGENDNIHTGVEIVRGGAGDDKLTAFKNAATFYSNAGNDVLTGGVKQDQLHGGPGDDTFRTTDGLQDFIFTGPGNDNLSQIDVGLDVVSHGD